MPARAASATRLFASNCRCRHDSASAPITTTATMNDSAAPRPSWNACIWFAISGAIITLDASPTSIGTKNIPVSGTKVSTVAEITPGQVCGKVTWRNARSGEAPRSAAASTERPVHLLERRVDRDDRERQREVRHHQDDRERAVEQERQRGVDPAERAQALVDDAGIAEQRHPGIGAQQAAGPERQDHRGEQHLLPAPRVAHDHVRERVRHRDRQHRDDDRRDQLCAAAPSGRSSCRRTSGS
jgi:hypothetical protein